MVQSRARALILAKKNGTFLYEGARVCQSFGNEHFYYTSCVMNCIYDCEYCYLKGMYPSGHMVLFVNLEDIFTAADELLKKHEVYLCISYDTDLAALEDITGYLAEWTDFAALRPNLTVEVRTKCARRDFGERAGTPAGMIYAYTLSPARIVTSYERGTPPLAKRLKSAALTLNRGVCVRLCFDPILYIPDWRTAYGELVEETFSVLDAEKITDCSVGSFRISSDYLKRMRKCEPDSALAWFPYQNEGGIRQYPGELRMEMEQYLCGLLKRYICAEKIFLLDDMTAF